jgi:hypothetical protein
MANTLHFEEICELLEDNSPQSKLALHSFA